MNMDDAIRFALRGSQWRGKDELARVSAANSPRPH
jgi:hypothetical protein